MFGIIIVFILIANFLLFKKIIFKIIGSGIIVIFFGFSFIFSQRYMKTQSINYQAKNQLYSILINNTKSYRVDSIKKYPLHSIQDFDVPKRISILSTLTNNCNQNDTIIELNVTGHIHKSQFWYVKKDSLEPLGILKY
ncbi:MULTISPECIES: hypothetical protein [unclassified Nonlabens]|uniref:hypothetical protein n=1 Tax=unclassified Nonlabens TaxID=2615035 RepID=UPI0038662253